jgi:hypothetical protein
MYWFYLRFLRLFYAVKNTTKHLTYAEKPSAECRENLSGEVRFSFR